MRNPQGYLFFTRPGMRQRQGGLTPSRSPIVNSHRVETLITRGELPAASLPR